MLVATVTVEHTTLVWSERCWQGRLQLSVQKGSAHSCPLWSPTPSKWWTQNTHRHIYIHVHTCMYIPYIVHPCTWKYTHTHMAHMHMACTIHYAHVWCVHMAWYNALHYFICWLTKTGTLFIPLLNSSSIAKRAACGEREREKRPALTYTSWELRDKIVHLAWEDSYIYLKKIFQLYI